MIWYLLLVYQLKHFIADYPLQGKYMLGKFKPYPDFIAPLFAHAWVHGAFTFVIAYSIKPNLAVQLAILDATAHFIVDRVKASPKLLGRFTPLSKKEYVELTQTEGKFKKLLPECSTMKEIAQKKRSNTYFWWALGLDQMMHHLTHYAIIWMLVR